MSGTNSRANDDCYYFYYSKCTKGSTCGYRHCADALGCEIMCPMWQEGRCYATNCKLRHTQILKDRKSIQCYWETQPGGCQKEHCVFMHSKPRGFGGTRPNSAAAVTAGASDSSSMKRTGSQVDVIKENAVPSPKVNPVLITVDHDDENSNGDKVPSPTKAFTPIVVTGSKTIRTKKNLVATTEPKELDLGIKSLEQIRKEKESVWQALGSGLRSPTSSADSVHTPEKAVALTNSKRAAKTSPLSSTVTGDSVVKGVEGPAKQSPVSKCAASAASAAPKQLPKKEQNVQEIRIKTFAEIMEEKRKRKEKELASREDVSKDASAEPAAVRSHTPDASQRSLDVGQKAAGSKMLDTTREPATASSASDVRTSARTAASGNNLSPRIASTGALRPTASVAPLDGLRPGGCITETSKSTAKRKSSASAVEEDGSPATKKARSPPQVKVAIAIASTAAEATCNLGEDRPLPTSVGLVDETDHELDELLADSSSGALKTADSEAVVNDEELMREMEVLLQ